MPLSESKIPAVVKNEFFYLFARVCMIIAATVGMPIAGFMLSRVVAKADEISEQVAKQNMSLQLISSEMKFRFDSVNDHEQRIRSLERK